MCAAQASKRVPARGTGRLPRTRLSTRGEWAGDELRPGGMPRQPDGRRRRADGHECEPDQDYPAHCAEYA